MPCMQGTSKGTVCATCQRAKVWCDHGMGSPKARKRVRIIALRGSPGGTEEGLGMGRWGAVIHEDLVELAGAIRTQNALLGEMLGVLAEGALRRAARRRRSEDEGEVAEVEDGEDEDGGPENSTPGAGPSRL